jgi:hypothetical protein
MTPTKSLLANQSPLFQADLPNKKARPVAPGYHSERSKQFPKSICSAWSVRSITQFSNSHQESLVCEKF